MPSHFLHAFYLASFPTSHSNVSVVLQPNDPDSYYQSRELIPNDMLDDLKRAKIVITNYHAFKLRERNRNVIRTKGVANESIPTSR